MANVKEGSARRGLGSLSCGGCRGGGRGEGATLRRERYRTARVKRSESAHTAEFQTWFDPAQVSW
jgi:hypothetical protein